MKQLFSFLSCMLTAVAALAQTGNNQQAPPAQPGHIHLVGTITTGADTTTYIVNLVVARDGQLSGYTLTEWRASGTLKANLTGSRDKDGNLVLDELPDQPSGNSTGFCYFHANLYRVVNNGKVSFEGSYTSLNEDGSAGSCGGGHMILRATGSVTDDPEPSAVPNYPSGGNIQVRSGSRMVIKQPAPVRYAPATPPAKH